MRIDALPGADKRCRYKLRPAIGSREDAVLIEPLAALFGLFGIRPLLRAVTFQTCVVQARPPVADFVLALGRLQPRLYSIASSRRCHPGEVHLTVSVVRYGLFERDYQGVASNFFAERLQRGQRGAGRLMPSSPAGQRAAKCNVICGRPRR